MARQQRRPRSRRPRAARGHGGQGPHAAGRPLRGRDLPAAHRRHQRGAPAPAAGARAAARDRRPRRAGGQPLPRDAAAPHRDRAAVAARGGGGRDALDMAGGPPQGPRSPAGPAHRRGGRRWTRARFRRPVCAREWSGVWTASCPPGHARRARRLPAGRADAHPLPPAPVGHAGGGGDRARARPPRRRGADRREPAASHGGAAGLRSRRRADGRDQPAREALSDRRRARAVLRVAAAAPWIAPGRLDRGRRDAAAVLRRIRVHAPDHSGTEPGTRGAAAEPLLRRQPGLLPHHAHPAAPRARAGRGRHA